MSAQPPSSNGPSSRDLQVGLLPGWPSRIAVCGSGLLLLGAVFLPESLASRWGRMLQLPSEVMQPLALLASGILFVIVLLLCLLMQQRGRRLAASQPA